MSYKSDLQNNNTDLQGILDMILALGLVDTPAEPVEPAIITFTVAYTYGNVEYQAEEGMTWQQWCESSYNTAGFYVYANQSILFNNGGDFMVNYSGSGVMPSDTIVANATYDTSVAL